MPSSTATTLASNRRKLRLAQHNNRGLTPSPTAQLAKLAVAVSSEPQQQQQHDDDDINNNNNSNNSPTPSPTLTAVSSNGSHEESLDPSVQQQHQHRRRSRSGNRRTIAAAAASSKNPQQQHQSSSTTSRGRSRRSRAATARRWHTGGGSISTTSSRNSIRQDEILAGLQDVEMAAAATDSVSPTIDNKSNNNNDDNATNNLALNLHVAESVDSDDNGTCFNSIGTTTPKQPSESTQKDASSENNSAKEVMASNNSNRLLHQPNLHTNNSNYHISESSKQTLLPAKNASQARRSKFEMAWNSDSASSPHNHNNPLSPLNEGGNSVTSMSQSSYPSPPPKKSNLEQRHLERTLQGRKGVIMSNRKKGDSIWDHPEEMMGSSSSNNNNNTNNHRDRNNNNRGGDNSTAYSDFEQDGNSHARGRVGRGGRDARATGGASIDSDADEKQMMESAMGFAQQEGGDNACGEGGEGVDALLNKPNMKAALGVGAAATLGAVVLGPVGLIVGAASVGIGMGFMQIPEEQRTKLGASATTSFKKARNITCELSDTMSTACAKYSGTDVSEVAEVVGKVVPDELMNTCASCGVGSLNGDGDETDKSNRYQSGGEDGHSLASAKSGGLDIRAIDSSPIANVERGMNRLVGDVFGDEQNSPMVSQLVGGVGGPGENKDMTNEDGDTPVGRRVACGRKGRVVPLSQIHSLRPSLQPRAWLDVMASAHTTREEKNEAMQEILILAKDKEISRWFLEEGILDSLMFILSNYFRNYSSFVRNEKPALLSEVEKEEPFQSFKQGGAAFHHAKLAANCCVALGKAHCAAVHTEGDLLLMSAYSRGSVPIERQLAQMLFEVPHHMKVMNTATNNSCANGDATQAQQQQQFDSAEFTLTELSMQQAEDLASSITALDDGRIDV